MSRHYFPSTVFRMTPKNTLREVFSHLGADVSTINWSELGFHHFEPAQRLFDAMPPACRAQADLVFRQIHLLACREGMDAINEATEMRHKGTHQFGPGSATNRYERAALVWLADAELFEQAVSLFGLRQLPWWRIKAAYRCTAVELPLVATNPFALLTGINLLITLRSDL